MCIRDRCSGQFLPEKCKFIQKGFFKLNECVCEPVSYTHLDVYKRQTKQWLKVRFKKCKGDSVKPQNN